MRDLGQQKKIYADQRGACIAAIFTVFTFIESKLGRMSVLYNLPESSSLSVEP